MNPSALLVSVLVCAVSGWLIAGAVNTPADPFPTPQPIPLPAAAVAMPVMFPAPPPIRDAPLFVSTANTPIPLSAWHLATIKRHYVAEPPRYPQVGR